MGGRAAPAGGSRGDCIVVIVMGWGGGGRGRGGEGGGDRASLFVNAAERWNTRERVGWGGGGE